MAEKRTLSPLHIGIYLIIFFAVWSVRELVIRPVFLDTLDGIVFQIAESSMKLVAWTLPAVLLIRYFQDDMWISLRDMFTTNPKWFKSAPILLLGVVVPLINALVLHGEIRIRPDFVPMTLIEGVMMVGITEEIVFRGFLLNAFLKKMKPWKAVLLDAILFALIHYPIWIYFGHNFTTILSSSISVIVISAFFAYSFIKTRNIFVPIVLHMLWNLLLMLFTV